MTKTFKIWARIEEITNYGEADEDYKDVDNISTSLGTFDTLEEAEKHLEQERADKRPDNKADQTDTRYQ